MKKKILIGIAIFLGIIIIAAAVLTVWQWRNIKALYVAVTTDEEVLDEKLRENDDKFAEEVKDYMQESIRDFNEEELEQIESGEKTKTEVLAKIIAEKVDENKNAETGNEPANNEVNKDNEVKKNSEAANTETADQIVARHVANLYASQNDFEARINSLAGTVTAYMHSYKATHPDITWRDAKIATVQHFMSTATGIESECYSKVNNEIAQLRAELKAIGADTAIADKVAASAENQMELKKSKVMSQYMSKMNNPG